MLPKNSNEPMGAPAIFKKQIEIKLLHPASTFKSWIQVSLKKESFVGFQILIVQLLPTWTVLHP
ncbi:MAG: hypothetical protein P8X74_14910 [Reinekea sp.]